MKTAPLHVRILSGPLEGKDFPVDKPVITLGRSPQADIPLNDKSVSRLHSKLHVGPVACHIEDLGSTNGTWLFGQRIAEKTLLPFDGCFCLGEVALKLVRDSDAKPSLKTDKTIIHSVRPVSLDLSAKADGPSEERSSDRTLMTIHQFHKVMTIIESDEAVQQKILRAFLAATGARKGFLLEHDLKSGRLVPTASRVDDQASQQPAAQGSGSIDSQIVERARNRFEAILAVGEAPPEVVICLPLLGRRHLNGVIYLIADGPPERFDLDDVRLFAFLAASAGMAVEHKRMVEFNAKNELLLATGMNTAELSHCVKNMLSALDGGLNLLKAGIDDHSLETISEAWSLLRIGHRRIEGVVMDILNASSDKKMRFVLHDINSTIREIGGVISPQLAFNKIKLSLKPHGGGHLVAQVDPSGIHRVLMNLLTNAEQAILTKRLEDNTFPGEIEIAAAIMQDDVVLSVADNGIGLRGIDPGQLFSPFSSTKGAGGTGLGLHVSKRIVEAHGGSISASERPGGGCQFTIRIPMGRLGTETRIIKLAL